MLEEARHPDHPDARSRLVEQTIEGVAVRALVREDDQIGLLCFDHRCQRGELAGQRGAKASSLVGPANAPDDLEVH